MEYLSNGFTIQIGEGCFPFSTDSVALADFVRLPRHATVLDLGSGCGTLGTLLCAKDTICQVTGIELDEVSHQTALQNIETNQLSTRQASICADLRELPSFLSPGSFSCCVSNPPYFTSGPQSSTVPLARREDTCSMEDLFHAAAWALKFGADFFLVHRPERFAELCACASRNGMEVKRVCLLRHKPDAQPSLTLVQCRKGAKPGLLWEEVCLYDRDGSPTDYYKTLYHI